MVSVINTQDQRVLMTEDDVPHTCNHYARRLKAAFSLCLMAVLMSVPGAITPARAASQGGIAAQSQGTILISMISSGLVRISKLNDINLGSWTGGDMTGTDTLCAFSSTWGYTLSASSQHGIGTGFRLTDGSGSFVSYDVEWRDSFNRQFALQNGVNTPFLWGIAFSTTCNFVGTNARLNVRVPAANLAGKVAGTYTDTLTLVIAPQ